MTGPHLIHGQVLLELERYSDNKSVYLDPVDVKRIEPGDVPGTSYLFQSGINTSVWVNGNEHETAHMISKAREMINQLSLGAAVGMIREEIRRADEKAN